MKAFLIVPLLTNFSLLGGLFSFIAMELRLFIYFIIFNHSVSDWCSFHGRSDVLVLGFQVVAYVLHTIVMRSVMWTDTCI